MADANALIAASGSNIPQTDPLGMVGKLAGAQNALNQNQLFQQQFGANAAMGPIFQQSIGPNGEIDYNKALTLMAKDPNAAWKVPEIANMIKQRELTDSQIKVQQAEGNLKNLDLVSRKLSSLMSQKEITRADLFAMYGDLVSQGVDPKYLQGPMMQLGSADGEQLREKLRPLALQAAGGVESLKAQIGQISQVDTGNAVNMVRTNPLTGEVSNLGRLGKGVTPDAAANINTRIVDLKNPTTGVPEKDTAQGLGLGLGGTGGGLPMAPTPAPLPGTTPGNSGPVGGVNTPAAIQAPAPPAPAPMATPGASAGGRVVAGPSPDREKLIESVGKESGDYKAGLDSQVRSAQTLQLQMGEIRDLLEEARTGGGTGLRARVAEIAQAMGVPKEKVDSIAGGSLANAQELEKFFAQQAMQVMRQSVGGEHGSAGRPNQLLESTFLKNNPSLDTDPRAIEKILDFYTKQYDYLTTEQHSFADYLKKPGADLSQWSTEWNKMVSTPRNAGGLGLISPEEKQNYSKGTSEAKTIRWENRNGHLVPVTK